MNDPILHPTAEQLQAFAESSLDGARRAVLQSHLRGCPACQGEVAEWQSLFAMLKSLPRYAPALHFADRVMAHVTLPDPWYVRAAARANAQLQVFVPKTTRGWATATAFLGLPIAMFGALVFWMLSKPYVTPTSVVAFGFDRAQSLVTSTFQVTLANILQSDAALFFARALDAVSSAGAGAAGALAVGVAMAFALSVYVLYQNLFRRQTSRDNHTYVSYSF